MSGGVVVTDQNFGDVSRERTLARRAGVDFAEHQSRTEDETAQAVAGARVVFVNLAPISRKVLRQLEPGATVIRYGVGYDNVDVVSAKELGIRVCNVPDYGVETVADHALAMLLVMLRKVSLLDRAVRERGWLQPSDLGSMRGFGKTTVGLIGTGRIGRAVAARLRPSNFHVAAYDPFVDGAELAALGINVVGHALGITFKPMPVHTISLPVIVEGAPQKLYGACPSAADRLPVNGPISSHRRQVYRQTVSGSTRSPAA